MGGKIALESEVGFGTTFTVTIPLKNTPQLSSYKIAAPFRKSAPRKQILLVEDYEGSILVATEMLKQFGYDYDVAQNGYDAVRKFRHGQYDVILMDVQMHGMDGLEATRRIREFEVKSGRQPTTIIAMTAHVREQEKNLCIGAGMNDFIAKPFDPSTLSNMLDQYVARKAKAS